MGFKTMTLTAQEGTVNGANQCTVRPKLLSLREVDDPDPGTGVGRKPIAWANFGTPASAVPDYFVNFDARYIKPDGTQAYHLSWSQTYYGIEGGWQDNWRFGAQEDLFQSATGVDLAAIVGNDTLAQMIVYCGDTHLKYPVPDDVQPIVWGYSDITGYLPKPAGEGLLTYKTRCIDAVLPAITPYVVGDTFFSFRFSVTPNTNQSSGTLYLRYKKGTNATADNYDGSVRIGTGVRGTSPVSYDYTLSGLEADQPYSFWLYMERDTNGLTTTTGALSSGQTQISGNITFGAGKVTYASSPTQARFVWTVALDSIKGRVLTLPASQVEVMLETDFNTYGWDGNLERTFYTTLSPEIPLTDTSTNRYFRAPDSPTQQELVGSGEIIRLRANRAYVFRLRVDYKGGATYPASGVFRTPDYSSARPEVSNQYCLGII